LNNRKLQEVEKLLVAAGVQEELVVVIVVEATAVVTQCIE